MRIYRLKYFADIQPDGFDTKRAMDEKKEDEQTEKRKRTRLAIAGGVGTVAAGAGTGWLLGKQLAADKMHQHYNDYTKNAFETAIEGERAMEKAKKRGFFKRLFRIGESPKTVAMNTHNKLIDESYKLQNNIEATAQKTKGYGGRGALIGAGVAGAGLLAGALYQRHRRKKQEQEENANRNV